VKPTKQSSFLEEMDCFAEPVIGLAKPDPLARNDAIAAPLDV
jgi:hypothetical protein